MTIRGKVHDSRDETYKAIRRVVSRVGYMGPVL